MYTKQNDTYDRITYKSSVDLTGASAIFKMEARDGTLLVNAAAEIIGNELVYQLQPGDTIRNGLHRAEFTVTFTDGKEKTFPEDGYLQINISKDIDTNRDTETVERIAVEVSLIEDAKNDAIAAADSANTQAEYAKTQGDYASTQGTYAKDQGDIAKLRTDELNGVDATQFKDRQDEFDAQLAQNTAQVVELAGIKLADLPEPIYIAHRGGANVYPENTMEAFKAAISAGVKILEIDMQKLSDNVVSVMHDETLDRTTTSTGNVKAQNSISWQSIVVDMGNWFNSKLGDTHAPTMDEVFTQLGRKAVIWADVKYEGTAQLVTDAIKKYHLEDSVVLQSSLSNEITYALNAGVQVSYMDPTEPATELVVMGVKYVSCINTTSETRIQELKDAGLKVIIYIVDRHVKRDEFLSLGVNGFITDDPVYVTGQGYKLTKAPFPTGFRYHGHIATNKGVYQDGGWGFPTSITSKDFVLQGWGSPIGKTSYKLKASIKFTEIQAGGNSANIFICANDDNIFSDALTEKEKGYQVIFRSDGMIIIYRMDGTTYASLGSKTFAPIVAGQTITVEVDVNSTSVTVTRTDIAAPNTHSTTDTTYRGGYFHMGRNTAGVIFSNVEII